MGILVVQNMLITGFDAPVEQVMYLDHVIKEHNLLQAIARVNRVAPHKSSGFVVDYVGVAHHLREALSAYDEKEAQEILQTLKESNADLDSLKFIHGQVKNFFQQYDVGSMTDTDACVDVLSDDEIRDEFIALVRTFTRAMDRVLPNPEALKFTGDLRLLSWISESARNRYRDEKLSIRDASRKIREIVDEFLVSKGVDPKIPPLPIFSEAFKVRVQAHPSPRARAEEITHAVRQHINENYETDPELYDRLGEKLEKVLAELVTKMAMAFTKCMSIPWKGFGPCCAPGCAPIAGFRKRSCPAIWAFLNLCIMYVAGAKLYCIRFWRS